MRPRLEAGLKAVVCKSDRASLAETYDAYRNITWGGGIYNSNGAVTINNDTISDNTLSVLL